MSFAGQSVLVNKAGHRTSTGVGCLMLLSSSDTSLFSWGIGTPEYHKVCEKPFTGVSFMFICL